MGMLLNTNILAFNSALATVVALCGCAVVETRDGSPSDDAQDTSNGGTGAKQMSTGTSQGGAGAGGAGQGGVAQGGAGLGGVNLGGGTPGTVACEQFTCETGTQDCCLGDGGPHCIPNFGSCGSGVVQCDQSNDCESSEVCCVSRPGGTFYGSSCVAAGSCLGGNPGDTLGCLTAADCDGQQCCPLSFGGGFCSLGCPD